ncbi:MAG: DUF6263 family protein [Phycisphaerae bacterium]|jgi:hypothetical protein
MNTLRQLRNTAVLLALVITAGASANDGEDDVLSLRPTWDVGQEFYVEWQGEAVFQRLSPATTPPPPPMRVTETWGSLCRVRARLPEGGFKLDVTFDRIAVNVEYGVNVIQADSDTMDLSKAEDPDAAALAHLLGRTYSVELDRNGVVQRVDGAKEILAAAERAAGDDANPAHLRSVLDSEELATAWNTVAMVYAFKDVRVDDCWQRTLETYRGPDRHTFKLEEIDQGQSNRARVSCTLEPVASSAPQRAERLWGVRYRNRQYKDAHGSVEFDLGNLGLMRFTWAYTERAETVETADKIDDGEPNVSEQEMKWQCTISVRPAAERMRSKAAQHKRD